MIIRIDNGKIISISESDDVTVIQDRETTTYKPAVVYPGFVDSHGHIFGLGTGLCSPALNGLQSLDECLELLAGCTPNRGEWVVGYGWNEEIWQCGSYPDKKYLDALFPDVPVVLFRVDGHALWVNSAALRKASIGRETAPIPGGEIRTDKSGNPTGILIDNAIYPVTGLLPYYTDNQARVIIGTALRRLASAGITEVHDMDVSPNLLRLYREMDNNGQLPLRIISFVQAQQDEYLSALDSPWSGTMLNIAGLKFYADGALGSRGAAMLDDYADRPGYRGLLLIDPAELFQKMYDGAERGFSLAIHAIGDAANRMALKTYGRLRHYSAGGASAIYRIEHAQHIHIDDLSLFNKYGVYAAIQPVHCISDAKMARKRLGVSQTMHYPWRSLLHSGAVVAGGSDFPIESCEPLSGISAFVNRIPYGEDCPWMGEQCISINDAIRAYTTTPHTIAGTKNRGEVRPGSDADFVILDRDLASDKAAVEKAKVLAVYSKGVLIYKA